LPPPLAPIDMYPYAHPGRESSHDMLLQMDQQQQLALEQQFHAMQLHQAQEMHHQLVHQQHMFHQQAHYVQQHWFEQYSYAVPEFPQQFPQPAFYMPPPPPQQMGWDGGGHQPLEERPPPRDKVRTSECRHFARGFCLRGDTCNFAHTTPKEKQGAKDSPTPHRTHDLPRRRTEMTARVRGGLIPPSSRAVSGHVAAAACTQKRPWGFRGRDGEQCHRFQRIGYCNRDRCPYMHGLNQGFGMSAQQAALSPGAGHFPLLPSRPRFVSDQSTGEKASPPSGDAMGETAGPESAAEMPLWASIFTDQAAEEFLTMEAAEESSRLTIRSDSEANLTSKAQTGIGKKLASEFSKATDAADETSGVTTDEPFHAEASVAA